MRKVDFGVMEDSIILGLIRNVAILLTVSILYDHFWASRSKHSSVLAQLLAGVFLGFFVVLLIITPWNYDHGIFFDTRSVMLAISGLFFGPIPTIVAAAVATAYRIFLGGAGVYMGVSVIVVSGLVGYLWRTFIPDWRKKNDSFQLLGLGYVVHLLMLACIFLLPLQYRFSTFKEISLSVLVIYPLATLLLGKYIIRLDNLRNSQKALIESERRWQFALEGTGDGIWDWNLLTNEVFYSDNWKTMLGYKASELKNHLSEWERIIHPDDYAFANEQINKHLNGETDLYTAELRLKCKDGSYKWILDTGKIIEHDLNGQPSRFIGTHKDISTRKENEIKLARERFLLDSLMNFVPELIYFKDLDSKFIRVNNATVTHLGCTSQDEVLGKSDADFFSPEFASFTRDIEQQIIRTKQTYSDEELALTKLGEYSWGITNKMPLLSMDGDVIGTFGLSVDINKQKKVELALKESEYYTKSILEAIPDLIFIVDSKGMYLDFKSGNTNEWGLTKEQFVGKNLKDVLPRHISGYIQETIDRVLADKRKMAIEYELELRGQIVVFECFIVPFDTNKVLAMVRNITQRKQIEIELRNSQEQLKLFAAHLQNVREEERVLLSREIHDELGQILIALKIDIGMYKQLVLKHVDLPSYDVLKSKYDDILELVDKTINTTRRIMTGLRPSTIELVGFFEAARLYVAEFQSRYNIECTFHADEFPFNFDEQKSIAFFRILQEALSNIVKHSHATRVGVQMICTSDRFVMKIIDNGIGLDTSKPMRNDAYGLLGMKERVFLLDGVLRFEKNDGGGTVVVVETPIVPGAD